MNMKASYPLYKSDTQNITFLKKKFMVTEGSKIAPLFLIKQPEKADSFSLVSVHQIRPSEGYNTCSVPKRKENTISVNQVQLPMLTKATTLRKKCKPVSEFAAGFGLATSESNRTADSNIFYPSWY